MSKKLNDINWKKIGIEAIIGFIVTMIALSLFTFVIQPAFTEKPELDLVVVNPKLVPAGDDVTFNITLENVGTKTAGDIFCFAFEDGSVDGYSQYDRAEGPDLLAKGKTTHLTFELKAPEEDEYKSTWKIGLSITYKFGSESFFREFEIIYEYLADSNKYHIVYP